MARTLHKHRQSLLAWYDDSISTGPLEGVNNKLKLLQRQAFGSATSNSSNSESSHSIPFTKHSSDKYSPDLPDEP